MVLLLQKDRVEEDRQARCEIPIGVSAGQASGDDEHSLVR